MKRSVYDALSDPEERVHLLPLLVGRADDEARLRYADWLTSRGDLRGELVRLSLRLSGPMGEPERTAALARLAAVELQVDETWLAFVRRGRIVHCGMAADEPPRVRFAFTCPMSWETLRPTGPTGDDGDDARHCDRCQRTVHRCDSFAEAESRALRGDCIAVPSRLVAEASDRFCSLSVGRPDPVAAWAGRLFAENR